MNNLWILPIAAVIFFSGCSAMTPEIAQEKSNEISHRAADGIDECSQTIMSVLDNCESCLNKAKEKRLQVVRELRREYPDYEETSRVFSQVDQDHLKNTMRIFLSMREIIVNSLEEALAQEREGNAQVQKLAEKIKTGEVEK